jgi:hypothetical protein
VKSDYVKASSVLLASRIFSRIDYKTRFGKEKIGQSVFCLDLLKREVRQDLLSTTNSKLEGIFQRLALEKYPDSIFEDNKKQIFLELVRDVCEDFLNKQYGSSIQIDLCSLKSSFYTKYLLKDLQIFFQVPLYGLINPNAKEFRRIYYPIYLSATEQFLEILLDNLIIEISNCVVYFTIMKFSYTYVFRQTLYRSKFLSLRNLERFKNNIIWQLRLKTYVQDPSDLYENCYRISVLMTDGITKRIIYANRTKQIQTLPNISLGVLTSIELRDFLFCRIDETIYFLSSSLRFLFTSVLGQFIGLVWRGVIDGLKR